MEKIQGYIDHFIYYNESNGYGVIELYTEEEDIICVGSFELAIFLGWFVALYR